MKNTAQHITLVCIMLLMTSCEQPRYNFDFTVIPREVVNFEQVNSQYDDYNSDMPVIESMDEFSLIFSTNRSSAGEQYDFISYECRLSINQVNGILRISADPVQSELIDTINTEANEWGPYFTRDMIKAIYQGLWGDDTESPARMFFSSDREGDMDIYCRYYVMDRDEWELYMPIDTLVLAEGLNSSADEGYLCIHGGEVEDREVCYFTSDRDGSFDIYRAVSDPMKSIEQTESPEITRVDILSGEADDKCPYIVNNMMVFTSNRDGGYGNFDLWYSLYEDGQWTTPENFGPQINTEYNEYRPIITPTDSMIFLNDLLIFSSDRPGGKGGFDLYYTGMDKSDN